MEMNKPHMTNFLIFSPRSNKKEVEKWRSKWRSGDQTSDHHFIIIIISYLVPCPLDSLAAASILSALSFS